MSPASAEWLLWPEAMAWLLSHDRAVTSEIGEWFRGRMADNRSAERVHEIRLSEIALTHLDLPELEDERPIAAAAAIQGTEHDLLRMLERGACVARGRRTGGATPELIPAWDWADSIIAASRSFELRGAHNREVKFYDVRIDASGLPGWHDASRVHAPEVEPAGTPTSPTVKSRGRPPGSGGYRRADEPLLEEMRQLVAQGVATSGTDAARIVSLKAKGASSNAAYDRLRKRYQELEDNGGK